MHQHYTLILYMVTLYVHNEIPLLGESNGFASDRLLSSLPAMVRELKPDIHNIGWCTIVTHSKPSFHMVILRQHNTSNDMRLESGKFGMQ